MFTINIYLRFALIVGGILGGIGLWAAYGFWYGFPFLLVGIVLLIGYLMLGTILSTNMLVSQQRLDEAEQRLKLTYFPKLLLVGYKGVYFMTHGGIAMQKRDFNTAEVWVKKALDAGLPSDNERGAALMQLVMIQAGKNNVKGAQAQFAELERVGAVRHHGVGGLAGEGVDVGGTKKARPLRECRGGEEQRARQSEERRTGDGRRGTGVHWCAWRV